MVELEDLRREKLSWVVARRVPLHCAFRSPKGTKGHIFPSLDHASTLVTLAGVRWKIDHHAFYDEVAFENGPKIADARVWGCGHGYEVEIDGVTRYQFQSRKPDRQSKAWTKGGHSIVVFVPHGDTVPVTSGEIVVNALGAVEHLPILILLGVLHLSNR